MEAGALCPLIAALYALVYVALPAGTMAATTASARGRLVALVSIPLLAGLAAFLPALIGFATGDLGLIEMEHPGHPLWILSELDDGLDPRHAGVLVALAALAVASGLVNLPRVVAALREVQAASARRRASSAAEAAGAVHAAPEP
jgi:hypothetical protein